MQQVRAVVVALILGAGVTSAQAQTASYTETADKVRFEQYTGSAGVLALWRLPSPGVSTFPGGSCTKLTVAGTTEKSSRFMAIYLFAKSEGLTYFVRYDLGTCEIRSFGMDG